ncbi:LysR family transcriptional regulator [Lutibaculum baratangense]|uniref:Glycine cleavage system transcriptional activator n=1 Tax=Lutibaculum baratangense AMV1 TaxID=631454 RepID=V4REG5_9HYPH|nr:LysR family transcriptional regulator [Lutibaculum baratangense]ESR24526.1 Glycine cleavage system transcriptional activator [Lutibaculum baratangense AMV1]
MDRPNLPLNGLRAFEVAARQGSFTRAAIELRVTQAAVSQQISRLEDLLGVTLFTRTSNGLVLTDEGAALHPVLTRNFDEIGDVLDRFLDGRYRETLHLGVVTTFAAGWLVERLPAFVAGHPGISLRLFTNNNRVDIAKEGLHMAIRFGDGDWPGLIAVPLFEAPLSPLCAPELAARLRDPADLAGQTLFRSYRADEWAMWFAAADAACPDLQGPVFDSSVAMAELAAAGLGVALLPALMFRRQLSEGRLARPFAAEIATGRYWLTRPRNKPPSPAMRAVESWLVEESGRA